MGSAEAAAPTAREVRQRLHQVIAAADEEERKAVLEEVKRIKPFGVDHGLNYSIVEHLCRSLDEFAQQSDPPVPLVHNVIQTIINTIPADPDVNEALLPSTEADGGLISLYDKVVPLVAAVLIRLSPQHFKRTERLLLANLLDEELLRVLLVSDVWCILFRASAGIQLPTVEFLFRLALEFPVGDWRRNNIHSLLHRLLVFLADEDRERLVQRFDPVTNSFHFAFHFLDLEERRLALQRLLRRLWSSDSCVLTDVESVCQLVSLQESPVDESTLADIKFLVGSMGDASLDAGTSRRLEECMRLLNDT